MQIFCFPRKDGANSDQTPLCLLSLSNTGDLSPPKALASYSGHAGSGDVSSLRETTAASSLPCSPEAKAATVQHVELCLTQPATQNMGLDSYLRTLPSI